MSAWKNLQGECEECHKEFMKNKLVEYEGKKYCEECYDIVQKNQTEKCNRCEKEFPKSDLKKYYGKSYCKPCKKLEQEERRKEKESKKDEVIEEILSESTTSNEEITELKEEIAWIKQMILNITHHQNVLPEQPQKSDTKVFDYIEDEPEFWKWLEDQDETNRAVKRFNTHGRKSPIDDGIKIFIKFLKDNGYTI